MKSLSPTSDQPVQFGSKRYFTKDIFYQFFDFPLGGFFIFHYVFHRL